MILINMIHAQPCWNFFFNKAFLLLLYFTTESREYCLICGYRYYFKYLFTWKLWLLKECSQVNKIGFHKLQNSSFIRDEYKIYCNLLSLFVALFLLLLTFQIPKHCQIRILIGYWEDLRKKFLVSRTLEKYV